MSLNIFIARNYVKFTLLEGTKNKPNSKPNKANLNSYGTRFYGIDGAW
jgi:hypothetical protein